MQQGELTEKKGNVLCRYTRTEFVKVYIAPNPCHFPAVNDIDC